MASSAASRIIAHSESVGMAVFAGAGGTIGTVVVVVLAVVVVVVVGAVVVVVAGRVVVVGAAVVVVVGGTARLHPPTVSLPAMVTAPVPAMALPTTLVVVPRLMLAPEKMLPLKVLAAPSVAELLTCQYTLQGFAAPPITTCEAPAVVSVSRVIWNTQTSVAEPVSVSVPTRFPVGMQYTPGTRLRPPRLPPATMFAAGQI
jgi:hypothetical protein